MSQEQEDPRTLRLLDVMIAFPALDAPTAFAGETDPKKFAYQAKFAVDPKDAKKIEAAMLAAAEAKWPGKGAEIFKGLVDDKRVALTKREYKSAKTGKVYGGFEGKYSISARNKPDSQPTILDAANVQVKESGAIKALIKSNDYVHVKLAFWGQDSEFGRRVNASMTGVRFARKGARVGDVASPDDFADIPVQEEDLV